MNKNEWITTFMKNLDAHCDEETRTQLMLSCGRECARHVSIKLAEASKGDVNKLISKLAKIIGNENCYRENDSVHLTYNKCLCKMVNKGPEKLPDTYCICSKGWLLEMFETAAQKPVKVEILQTIKRGHPSCKFIVKL
jgi:predicted hydrocarbon binding protein